MTSQKTRVLRMIQHNSTSYGRGACATDFLRVQIPRAAARVAELRADGYRIVTEPCSNRYHQHRTPQIQYRIEESPNGQA